MLPFFGLNMLLKILRCGLGGLIVAVDKFTRPPQIQRSPEQQKKTDEQLNDLSLYQLYACPFCVKTRRVMFRLNLNIETKNVNPGSLYRDELMEGGGQIMVPCLRIKNETEDKWMYESSDIIDYLEKKFG